MNREDPGFRPLFTVECDVGEIRSLGRMPMGERRVVSIDGSRIIAADADSGLSGTILGGGIKGRTIVRL